MSNNRTPMVYCDLVEGYRPSGSPKSLFTLFLTKMTPSFPANIPPRIKKTSGPPIIRAATRVVVVVVSRPRNGTINPNKGLMNPRMIRKIPILLLKEVFFSCYIF